VKRWRISLAERNSPVKLASVLFIAALSGAPSAFAQKLDLKLDTLAAKASAKAEIDLDANMLRLLMRMSGEHVGDGILNGVRAIRVRSYTFGKSGGYSQQDLDAVRAQVNGQPRWAKIVNTKEGEDTSEIWVAADGDKFGACLIIAAETNELSVVYLEGTLSLAQVKGFLEHDGAHELIKLADQ
jgi:hypothetical protein